MLAGMAAVPVSAQATGSPAETTDRAVVAGTHPSWALPQARVDAVDTSQQREIRIALGLRDPSGARQLAQAVSTPGSPQYGQFITAQEFADRYGPTAETVSRVQDWLRGQGLALGEVAGNRHFVAARGTVAQLQVVFGVRLATYRKGPLTLAAPESDVSVPRSVRPAITAVLGLDDSDRAATATAHPDQGVTPADTPRLAAPDQYCSRYWGEHSNRDVPQKYGNGRQSNRLCGYTAGQTRAIYGLGAGQTGAGQTIAATGLYASRTIVEDTQRWAREAGAPPLAPGQYENRLPPGGIPSNCSGGDGEATWNFEQTMDIQAAHATAPAAQLLWYASGDCNGYDGLNRAVAEDRAGIITNSWTSNLRDNEIPSATREQFEAIAVQAAVQGQALLFASGDIGDDSRGTRTPGVRFPVSSPWVTAVGGTTVALDRDNKIAFTGGWENSGNTLTNGRWVPQNDADGPFAGGAGGGRSTIYDLPAYQHGVVGSSDGKRAVPDIGALSDNYTGMLVGATGRQGYLAGPAGGTSLGSPLMAGIVADAAQAHGQARPGFLNPALYRLAGNSAAVTDVVPQQAGIWTQGMGAPGGVTVPNGPGDYLVDVDSKPQSLQSARGWDPVTGIGTPTTGFVAAFGR